MVMMMMMVKIMIVIVMMVVMVVVMIAICRLMMESVVVLVELLLLGQQVELLLNVACNERARRRWHQRRLALLQWKLLFHHARCLYVSNASGLL